jgi:hypothetical protein
MGLPRPPGSPIAHGTSYCELSWQKRRDCMVLPIPPLPLSRHVGSSIRICPEMAGEGGAMPETSSLAAVVDQDGEVQILALARAFCAGEPFDGKVFQQPPDTPEEVSIGRPRPGLWQTNTDLAAAGNVDGRLEVAVVGGDGALWHAWQDQPGGPWSAWDSLGLPPEHERQPGSPVLGGTRTDGWSSSPWRPEPSGTAGSREPGRVLDTTGCRCGTLPAAGSPWRHRRSRSTMTVAWSWASIRAMRLVGGRSARSSGSPRR